MEGIARSLCCNEVTELWFWISICALLLLVISVLGIISLFIGRSEFANYINLEKEVKALKKSLDDFFKKNNDHDSN